MITVENIKEENKPHPFSKEARKKREREAEAKKGTQMENIEEKSIEEIYGLPKIDPDKVYEFSYITKPISKSVWISGTCKIFDHVQGRQRIIRYVPFEESIFEDEQSEPIAGGKRYYDNIYFPGGSKRVKGVDRNLILFLMLTDDNEAKSNRLKKTPPIFRHVDKEEDARKSMEANAILNKAMSIVQDSPIEDLIPFAAVSGVEVHDPENREAQIRIGVTRLVRKSPSNFLRAFKDPKYARKFTIHRGFQAGIISATHIKNAVVWKDSLVKVTDVPPDDTALDYLTDWSFSKDGEEFFSTLKRMVD